VIDSDRMKPEMSAEKAVDAIISFFGLKIHEN